MMQENISTIHGFCTHSAPLASLFAVSHTLALTCLHYVVYTSGVHKLSLLPHGDVVASVRRRRLPSLCHRRRPINHCSVVPRHPYQCLVLLLYPVRPFCSTFRELHSFLPHRNPSYHPVSLCPCRTLAPTDCTTIRCLTAVCYCLDYLPPLRHSYP